MLVIYRLIAVVDVSFLRVCECHGDGDDGEVEHDGENGDISPLRIFTTCKRFWLKLHGFSRIFYDC